MTRSSQTVSVSILDKEYQVACPPEQQAELLLSARYLDQQMRAIRESGKVIGLERIAVMAALNISHELLLARQETINAGEAGVAGEGAVDAQSLASLNNKLEQALQQLRQMELG